MRIPHALGAVLLSAALVACGDSNNNAPPQAPGQTGITITIPAGAMNLGDGAYAPNPAMVAPGMVVTWVNQDSVPHTATANDGQFDSEAIAPGGSWSWTVPSDPGDDRINYFCEFHPGMRGSLVMPGASPSPSPSPSSSPTPTPSPSSTPSPAPR
jgi:plastocyanin